MAERHISLPKPFSSGDVKDWFQRFEICATANGWKEEDQAIKLPTLLEGEALAIWLELTADQQKDYTVSKREIQNAMMPVGFVSLDEFHRRKLRPGEAIPVFVHDLKKLLEMAIPGMNKEAKDALLLHQFVAGLPELITKQLRASGEVKTLEGAVTRARLLMTVDAQAVSTVKDVAEEQTEVQKLRDQVALLTEQMASLSTRQGGYQQQRRRPRCFICGQPGHVQRDCPAQQNRLCFSCGQPGHLARNCWYQGNGQGASAQGSRRPRP